MVMSVNEAFDIAEQKRARRKAKKRAAHKKWKAANKEKEAARMKDYYNNNKEACDARHKAWCDANPEKAKACKRAAHKAWCDANPEKAKACKRAAYKKWKAANPDYHKAYHAELRKIIFEHYDNKCSCPTCKSGPNIELEIDHIIPFAEGLHKHAPRSGHSLWLYIIKNECWNDFQILCKACNTRKHWNGGTCNCGVHSGKSKLLL